MVHSICNHVTNWELTALSCRRELYAITSLEKGQKIQVRSLLNVHQFYTVIKVEKL
jgi:hypothetical protein